MVGWRKAYIFQKPAHLPVIAGFLFMLYAAFVAPVVDFYLTEFVSHKLKTYQDTVIPQIYRNTSGTVGIANIKPVDRLPQIRPQHEVPKTHNPQSPRFHILFCHTPKATEINVQVY